MQLDPIFQHRLSEADAVIRLQSAAADFEFLCGFSHQALCLLEEYLRECSSTHTAEHLARDLQEFIAMAQTVHHRFGGRAQQTSLLEAVCDGAVSEAMTSIVSDALRSALSEMKAPSQPWETGRRWARGHADEQFAIDAPDKKRLVMQSMDSAYDALALLADSLARAGSPQRKCLDAILDVIDWTLGHIDEVTDYSSPIAGSNQSPSVGMLG